MIQNLLPNKYRYKTICKLIFWGSWLCAYFRHCIVKTVFSHYCGEHFLIILSHVWTTGFGFLSFEDEEAVDRCVAEHFVNLNGKQV